PILAGNLGVVPIGAILQLLQAENQTGTLVCTNAPPDTSGAPSAEIRATFRAGLIDLVQSTGAGDEFRLGRFFIEEGILSDAEIETFMNRGAASVPRFGTAMPSVIIDDGEVPLSQIHIKNERI